MISGSVALLGETHEAMVRRVDGIGDTMDAILAESAREDITPLRAAERRAEAALATARRH